MKSAGKLYLDIIQYPIYKNRFIVEKGWTNETDHPYRHGTCVIVKPPFIAKAMVFGVWGKQQSEVQSLENAIMMRELDFVTEEIREW